MRDKQTRFPGVRPPLAGREREREEGRGKAREEAMGGVIFTIVARI